jgi:Secretion system C-terminal sorting domain
VKVVSFSDKNSTISIQQNPVVNNQLVLNITKPVTISIYDYTGKIVYRKQYGAGVEIISVSNWAKGQYFAGTDKETIPFLIH